MGDKVSDLMLELQEKTKLLDKAVYSIVEKGRAYAQAEHDYKVALSKRILAHRADGMPVSIISDICRGEPEIADLRLKKDIAEVQYKATSEAIQNYKLQIRILDAQIEREWRG